MSDLVLALFGARGMGKSAAVKAWLAERPPARLMIWDTMDEYAEQAELAPRLERILELAGAGRGGFAVRYVPRGTDQDLALRFGAFCSIAYAAGDLVMIVEELQRVTRPSWAPAAWSDCTLRGRHRDLSIIGLSQRPASVDKNFFSNATRIRTGRLNFADDVACMANVLGVDRAEISGLAPLAYIERDMMSGELERGRLTFPAPTKNRSARRRRR